MCTQAAHIRLLHGVHFSRATYIGVMPSAGTYHQDPLPSTAYMPHMSPTMDHLAATLTHTFGIVRLGLLAEPDMHAVLHRGERND